MTQRIPADCIRDPHDSCFQITPDGVFCLHHQIWIWGEPTSQSHTFDTPGPRQGSFSTTNDLRILDAARD